MSLTVSQCVEGPEVRFAALLSPAHFEPLHRKCHCVSIVMKLHRRIMCGAVPRKMKSTHCKDRRAFGERVLRSVSFPTVQWSAKLNVSVLEPDPYSDHVAAVSQSAAGSDRKY